MYFRNEDWHERLRIKYLYVCNRRLKMKDIIRIYKIYPPNFPEITMKDTGREAIFKIRLRNL